MVLNRKSFKFIDGPRATDWVPLNIPLDFCRFVLAPLALSGVAYVGFKTATVGVSWTITSLLLAKTAVATSVVGAGSFITSVAAVPMALILNPVGLAVTAGVVGAALVGTVGYIAWQNWNGNNIGPYFLLNAAYRLSLWFERSPEELAKFKEAKYFIEESVGVDSINPNLPEILNALDAIHSFYSQLCIHDAIRRFGIDFLDSAEAQEINNSVKISFKVLEIAAQALLTRHQNLEETMKRIIGTPFLQPAGDSLTSYNDIYNALQDKPIVRGHNIPRLYSNIDKAKSDPVFVAF